MPEAAGDHGGRACPMHNMDGRPSTAEVSKSQPPPEESARELPRRLATASFPAIKGAFLRCVCFLCLVTNCDSSHLSRVQRRAASCHLPCVWSTLLPTGQIITTTVASTSPLPPTRHLLPCLDFTEPLLYILLRPLVFAWLRVAPFAFVGTPRPFYICRCPLCSHKGRDPSPGDHQMKRGADDLQSPSA